MDRLFRYGIGCVGLLGIVATVLTLLVALVEPKATIQILQEYAGISPAPLVITQVAISSPAPTYTPYPTYTPGPACIPCADCSISGCPQITATPTTASQSQDPPPGSVVPFGEAFSMRGVLVFTNPEIHVSGDRVQIRLTIRNERPEAYLLRFRVDVFHLSDDTGRDYPLTYWRPELLTETFQVDLAPNTQHNIEFDYSGSVYATNLGYFSGPIPVSAKSLTFTADEIAGIVTAAWRFDLQ